MDTYTVSGLTAKEVRRLGENKWFYTHWKSLILGLGLPFVVEIILMFALPQDFNRIGRVIFVGVPALCLLWFYWVWISQSTKQGKAFLSSIKEAK